MLHNYEKYVDFFSCQFNPCQPPVSMYDALLSELVQFFDDSSFNRNVVDLLVQIASDALNVNIITFQNNNGEIQVLSYRSGEFGEKIYMKYSHDNCHSGGNHYELLVKMKKFNITVLWPSNFMKATLTNNDQELPLDLSQSLAEAHVLEPSPTEDDVTKQGDVQVNVSSPIHLVYTTETNHDEEIIYIQNMPIYEDG